MNSVLPQEGAECLEGGFQEVVHLEVSHQVALFLGAVCLEEHFREAAFQAEYYQEVQSPAVGREV